MLGLVRHYRCSSTDSSMQSVFRVQVGTSRDKAVFLAEPVRLFAPGHQLMLLVISLHPIASRSLARIKASAGGLKAGSVQSKDVVTGLRARYAVPQLVAAASALAAPPTWLPWIACGAVISACPVSPQARPHK